MDFDLELEAEIHPVSAWTALSECCLPDEAARLVLRRAGSPPFGLRASSDTGELIIAEPDQRCRQWRRCLVWSCIGDHKLVVYLRECWQTALMVFAEVLGISVDEPLVERWRGWFAPPVQPFRTDLLPPEVAAAVPARELKPTPEWEDTFFMYSGTWTWLSEEEFNALRPSLRRSLTAVRRRTVRPKSMPAWPSELASAGDDLMFRWIESGTVRPSEHQDVPAPVWKSARSVLPDVQALAGTFPTAGGSRANCFGTVMAATGLDVSNVQIGPDEFQDWLDKHTEGLTGTRCDDEPGLVFAWTEHGKLAHATVSIGGGWMFGKDSQAWSSPRSIRTVRSVVNSWVYPTARVSRHRICQ